MAQVVQQQKTTIFYQMSTSNKSFIDMHYILKKLGIKNNRFMLALIDPDLAGINPFDPNLNLTMKHKVLRECTNNYWYFLREVIRIPVEGVPGGIHYFLHRGNLAMNYCMMYNLNIFMELPRQQGKTISAVCRYLWIYNFGTNNSEITFLNKKKDDSKLNLQRLKDIRDMLPSYLQMNQTFTFNNKKVKVPTNVETMVNPTNSNSIKTAPSARTKILAANLLRGHTLALWWSDEWAFIPFNKTIYLNTVPAFKTASINAMKAGKPYGILMTTTPGILTTEEGNNANEMRLLATDFNETWYDKTYDELMYILNANEKSNFVYIRYTYKQIGRDEKWFADLCKDLQWDWNTIRREVLLEWADNPENSPFAKEDLETIGRMVHQPVDIKDITIFHKTYQLKIYNNRIPLKPDYTPKYPPIIGVDVSGGYNQDASAITIIDSHTTEVIADFKSNSISPINLARMIYQIVTRWYPNAIINVERNGGFGASVLAKLLETKLKPNIYYEIKDRVIEETNDGLRVVRKKKKTKVFGIDNTHDRRELLIEILKERVEGHKDKFISPVIHQEMKGMEIKRNGKVEHSSTSHDDQVFSYLMALYVWYEGKNLKELFNIDKVSIKTDDDIDEVIEGLEEDQEDITTEIEYIQRDDNDEVSHVLNTMMAAAGILYGDFIKGERAKEDELTRLLLQNRAIKEQYAKTHHMTLRDVDDMFGNSGKNIPDTVLMNFNSDSDEPDIAYRRYVEEQNQIHQFNDSLR